jgi:hypothetical protein
LVSPSNLLLTLSLYIVLTLDRARCIMSHSYSVSSESEDDGFEITGDIRIVQPKEDCDDEVRTTLVGAGKTAAGPKYANTNAYLGLYKGDIVEAYFKKAGNGFRVHCSVANWTAINERLDLNSSLKQLSQAALVDAIRERTRENPPLGAGSTKIPEGQKRRAGAGASREVEDWCRDVRPREQGAQEGDTEAGAREQGGGVGVSGRGDITTPLQTFHMRLIDIALVAVFGVLVAYISIGFAFLLIHFSH